LVTACGKSYEETKREAENRREAMRKDSAALKVAVLPTLDCLPLYVAEYYQLFDTINGGVRLNFDLRMAASYCWRDWYVGATGQVHRFRSNNDNTTLKLTEWTVKAFIGMRL
jgi:hypothetical protein